MGKEVADPGEGPGETSSPIMFRPKWGPKGWRDCLPPLT